MPVSKLRDVEMSAVIKLALVANPRVGGLDISVNAVNGIVFLEGFVQDRAQRNLAEDIAQRHGAVDIRNDIEVLSEVEDGRVLLEAQNDTAADRIIRDHVAGDLESDGRINASMINVDSAGGVIRLTGVQDTHAARSRAEQIAWRVDGVEEVVNDIAIREELDRAA